MLNFSDFSFYNSVQQSNASFSKQLSFKGTTNAENVFLKRLAVSKNENQVIDL